MWSLKTQEWKDSEFWLSNRRFRRHSFSRNDLPLIPATSGIYLMVARPVATQPDILELRNVMYVGKSENLKQRFSQHSGNTATPNIRELLLFFGAKLEFWFVELPLDKISEAEQCFITCFKPQANTKGIPGRLRPPIPL